MERPCPASSCRAPAVAADLGGAIRFTLKAERVGLKPIVGVELEVDGHPTALLAADAAGYRNLATLTTLARVGHPIAEPASPAGDGRARDPSHAAGDVRAPGSSPAAEPARGRPGVSFEALASHAAGLWCLTGPATGELATLLRSRRHSEAIFQLDRWRSVFSARLAVEVQLHHVSGEESALAASLIELAERGGVRWVGA
jgi:DNA polymerase III alpha subunit